MNFLNEFILGFTTKHPYQVEIIQASERGLLCSWDKTFLILVKALKPLFALSKKYLCVL